MILSLVFQYHKIFDRRLERQWNKIDQSRFKKTCSKQSVQYFLASRSKQIECDQSNHQLFCEFFVTSDQVLDHFEQLSKLPCRLGSYQLRMDETMYIVNLELEVYPN